MDSLAISPSAIQFPNPKINCDGRRANMLKPTPDEIEHGLTDEDEIVRVAFAGRNDYTPIPAQIERGLTDKRDTVRWTFAIRKDYTPTPSQIERGLRDKSHLVRTAFAERKRSTHPIIQQNSNTFCRGRMLGDTDIVECMMEVVQCQWAVPYRNSGICNHPSAKQFVVFNPAVTGS